MALSWVVMELCQKHAFSDHLRWHVAHSETHPEVSGLTGAAPGAPQAMLVDTLNKRNTKAKAQPGFSGRAECAPLILCVPAAVRTVACALRCFGFADGILRVQPDHTAPWMVFLGEWSRRLAPAHSQWH